MHQTKRVFIAALAAFVLFISPVKAQEQKDTAITTQLLSSTTTSSGQSIILPKNNVQIVASIFDGLSSTARQAHNHPYPRYVYVLSGTLRVNNLDTGQINSYRAGSFVLESVGQWQTAASVGDEPLKLLVVDVVENGQSNTVGLR
jgi:quercetin dioxygenase-like cupin family protein